MKVLTSKKAIPLLIVGLLMYSSAYVGRMSFSSNMTSIMQDFGVDKEATGVVLTLYFIVYGFGQLLHGFFAKRYAPKYFVPAALLVSAAANLTLGLTDDFIAVYVVWTINAAAQSFLWCNLVNTQARFFSDKDIHRAIIANSFCYIIGFTVNYALSAAFTALGVWRCIFYFSAALLAVMAILWFFAFVYSERHVLTDGVEDPARNAAAPSAPLTAKKNLFRSGWFCLVFVFLGVLSICKGAADQGLGEWQPTILYEVFKIDKSFSILLSILPTSVAVLSTVCITQLKKKFVTVSYMMFSGALYLVGAATFFCSCTLLEGPLFAYLTVFTLFRFMIGGVGNVITSAIPFALRDHGNSGALSSLLDACVYAGEAIAMSLFGVLAENLGWLSVLYLCGGLLVLGGAAGVIGGILARRNHITRNM